MLLSIKYKILAIAKVSGHNTGEARSLKKYIYLAQFSYSLTCGLQSILLQTPNWQPCLWGTLAVISMHLEVAPTHPELVHPAELQSNVA